MGILEIILTSLYVSLTSTAIASIIAILLAVPFSIKDFKLKRAIYRIADSLMAMPPVVMGLIVFIILSKRGPLGELNLLFTPTAMIIAQTLLILPIIFVLTVRQIEKIAPTIQKNCYMLGGDYGDFLFLIINECKGEIFTSVTSGFSRAISEVGAVMMVGGNIKGYTRVMTTFIALETSKGNFKDALIIGLILLVISFLINIILHSLKGRETNEYIN